MRTVTLAFRAGVWAGILGCSAIAALDVAKMARRDRQQRREPKWVVLR